MNFKWYAGNEWVLRSSVLGLCLLGLGACGFLKDNETSRTRTTRQSASEKAIIVGQLVTELDSNGNPLAVKGFSANSEVLGGRAGEPTPAEAILAAEKQNAPLFTFDPPQGYGAAYSGALIIPTTQLTNGIEFTGCDAKSYETDVPKVGTVVSFIKQNQACGPLALNFCMKLSGKETILLKSPVFKFSVPCPADTFAGVTFAFDSKVGSEAGKLNLVVNASAAVSEMYVTNTAGCQAGGQWQATQSSISNWSPVAASEGKTRVYATFRDFLGNQSACLEASGTPLIAPAAAGSNTAGSQAPSSPSIAIEGGASYTKASSVGLSLSAVGASSMYLTNTAGCTSGGNWANYATSASWSLAQTNTTASVYAKFKNAAGLESACVSASIIHDSEAPTSVSLVLDSGASLTNTQTVSVALTAPGASHMYLSNTAGCAAGGAWAAFVSPSAWTLGQSNGTAVVYAKVKDAAGNESSCTSASIVHDDLGPTAASFSINNGASYTTSTSVSLSLAASDASKMYITNTGGCASGGAWTNYATSSAWTLGQTNAMAHVYVKFKDDAGNETACLDRTITHDTIAPQSTGLTISAGNTYTAASSVTLGLAANDAYEMYITNSSGCAAGGSWESYATTKAGWGLGQTNATASVYAKFRDQVLNESSCVQDTIVHDSQAPSDPTGFSDGSSTSDGGSSPNLTWSAASDNGPSGLAGYQISIGASVGGTDMVAWQAVGNVTNASITGLNLSEGTTYYASLRAIDHAGNVSSSVDGDGFTYTSAGWTQQAYIKAANNTANYAVFGTALAMSGQTLVVGASREDGMGTTISNGTTADTTLGIGSRNAGAVFVYVRTATSWQQQAYIKPSDNGSTDLAGFSVGIDGNTLAVGAPQQDSDQTTISNGTNLVNNDNKSNSGVVYVYQRTGTTWAPEATIKANNADASDAFGSGLALSGDLLAVTAPQESSGVTTITNGATSSTDNSASGAGAVYVYKRTGTIWDQEAYIKAANAAAGDNFGHSVSDNSMWNASIALYSETLAVGAPKEDSNEVTITNGTAASTDNSRSDAGAVYVYKRTGLSWSQQAYIKAPNATSSDYFGTNVSLYGDTLAVGTEYEDSNQLGITNGTTANTDDSYANSGAVYVFLRTATSWQQQAYIKPSNTRAGTSFGNAVSLGQDMLAVGSMNEDSNVTTIINNSTASSDTNSNLSGAAYIYKRTGTTWTEQAYIKAANNTASDNFGEAVVLHNNTLAVSSPDEDSSITTITNGTTASTDNSIDDAGAVYIYTR